MCVKISLVKFTDGFPVFWLLSCILIADCFVILSMLPFWGRSHFEYMHSFWMRSQFECVLILSVFSFWICILILSVFSFWMRSHFECVLIWNAISFWVCSHLESVLILSEFSFGMRSHFECVLIGNAFSFWVCSHWECVLILSVFSLWMLSHFECARILTVSQDPTRALLDLIPHSSKGKTRWHKSARKGMSVYSKTYEGLWPAWYGSYDLPM